MGKVAKVKFTNYEQSIAKALDLIGAADKLPDKGLISREEFLPQNTINVIRKEHETGAAS